MNNALPFLIIISIALSACGDSPVSKKPFVVEPNPDHIETESPSCTHKNSLRQAFFGDTHVHTSWSADSYMFGVRLTPDDAYNYAFGGEARLPIEGDNERSDGSNARVVRIDRPLDFVAVTDHAETLGEVALCTNPSSTVYQAGLCSNIRNDRGRAPKLIAQIMWPATFRYDEVCEADSSRCLEAARGRWQQTIEAAEKWNDGSSDCERTTFIGYEYSSYRLGSNLHRNVLFKNNIVPTTPTSYVEAPREWDLWNILKSGCIDSGSGCDVLAIPHNSNISNGRMFNVEYRGLKTREDMAARNALRMEIEPIIEVMQHKGDSECRNGLPGILNSEDELCEFEKFADWSIKHRFDEVHSSEDDLCSEGIFADLQPHIGPDCSSRLNFARYALIEGLREEKRTGINHFKFGFTAATDTHNATAGGVEERSYAGHIGIGDDTVADRVSWGTKPEGNTANNPGGLTGVWAEQNNRNSLFNAMRRKEVFGTSGPRIRPRFFAAPTLADDLCKSPKAIEKADLVGVPMGGELSRPQLMNQSSPAFLAMAMADAGTELFPGTPLQRLQIIKGWLDAEGVRRTKVFEVAGDPNNGASVDISSCQQTGEGFGQLCGVWRDPTFDPSLSAVYYMRAVENPSCRYNAWQCIGLKGEDRPADCDHPEAPKIIQERAWTSPIWYDAGAGI